MPKKTKSSARAATPKKPRINPQERSRRLQQILFLALAIIVVVSMVLALVVR
jgi:hypothetical protein